MGKQLIQQLLPALNKISWPDNDGATEMGRRIYVQGVERIDDYTNDPKVLSSALKLFQTSDSRPYAFAGVAYMLVAASREKKDGSYDEVGLDAAMDWLEKAQETEPDIVEINMIEALVYAYGNRLDDARLVLDYLQGQEPTEYMLHLAEIAYWLQRKDVDEAVHWFGQASQSALTVPQRLRLQARMADMYADVGSYDKAVEVYRKAIHFDKKNYMLWHKLSVVYWRQENFEEADVCNRNALKLKDFPAGRKMEAGLKERKGNTGMLSRFRRRSK
ncbi:MAG: tetratricopeptide repeat protein [Chloroflexi bacterium]|nr:tetratricopeptide repeat protein [Chloroflexota bacterium]